MWLPVLVPLALGLFVVLYRLVTPDWAVKPKRPVLLLICRLGREAICPVLPPGKTVAKAELSPHLARTGINGGYHTY